MFAKVNHYYTHKPEIRTNVDDAFKKLITQILIILQLKSQTHTISGKKNPNLKGWD